MGVARRILIVEDEPIVAIALQDMLEDLGYEVAGPAFRVAAALALAGEGGFDAAILDVNMGDGESYCVADRLKAAGIPYLFATGYGREGLAAGHADAVVLRKPYRETDVAAALQALLG
ncbi:response regulator [Allosphingosinicella sp.]|jgi:CheY-like chemotaxis protein|uniref:response regulator n=1 Tax=Allosphingosinicella sp. TaxID=2823234 RepID=UPI002F104465